MSEKPGLPVRANTLVVDNLVALFSTVLTPSKPTMTPHGHWSVHACCRLPITEAAVNIDIVLLMTNPYNMNE